MTGVRVRFLAHLRRLSREPEIQIRLSDKVKLKDFLKVLARNIKGELRREIFDEKDHIRSNFLVLVNEIEISALDRFNTEISNNDIIVILPFIHGGKA
ncbi:MAG: MoaD/ThiS family protein [Candidatus Hodarchaeota archaeon]